MQKTKKKQTSKPRGRYGIAQVAAKKKKGEGMVRGVKPNAPKRKPLVAQARAKKRKPKLKK